MIVCDSCQSEVLAHPGRCARCAVPSVPKHPGRVRIVGGLMVYLGAALSFDQTPFAAAAHDPQLMLALHLMWISVLSILWGVHRKTYGPTRQALRRHYVVFIAKRYLRRAYAHQRRMGRVL